MSFTESVVHQDGVVSVIAACDSCASVVSSDRRYRRPGGHPGQLPSFATAETSEIIVLGEVRDWAKRHLCGTYAEQTETIIAAAEESNDVEALAGMLRAIAGKHELVKHPRSGHLECRACLYVDAYASHGHDYSSTRRELARRCTAHGTIHDYYEETTE